MKPSERADIVLDIMGIPRHPKVREPIERGLIAAERGAFEAALDIARASGLNFSFTYDDWQKERDDEAE